MKKDTVVEFRRPQQKQDLLSTMLREGARHLIAQAVRAEFEDFLAGYSGQRAVDGRRAVVRNGFQPEREILTGLGPVAVQVPKARSRGEEPAVFRSSLVPPYVRSARSVEAALPWLYLHGVSTGNMHEALAALLGPEAAGLSASAVARLKGCWMEEYRQWCRSKLDRDRWVYVWVDGIYSGLRAEDEWLCALVVIGVNELGQKKFLAIEDGVRESKQSWREVLLGLKGRGLTIPPKLAVGDGALGFWAAVREVFPETRQQRCWVHKTANVLNYLPKSLQPKAKAALHEIWMAETKSRAFVAFERFVAAFGAKYPKARGWQPRRRAPARSAGGAGWLAGQLGELLGVAVEDPEQLNEGERRPGLAGLVAGEGVHAAAEDRRGLLLVERELPADAGDEGGIDHGRVHPLVELEHRRAGAGRLGRAQHGFAAGGAVLPFHARDPRGLALVGVGDVALLADELCGSAGGALHGSSSLNETTRRSSITVSFR